MGEAGFPIRRSGPSRVAHLYERTRLVVASAPRSTTPAVHRGSRSSREPSTRSSFDGKCRYDVVFATPALSHQFVDADVVDAAHGEQLVRGGQNPLPRG